MKKQLKQNLLRFVLLLAAAVFGGQLCDDYFQTSFPIVTIALVVMVSGVFIQVLKK